MIIRVLCECNISAKILAGNFSSHNVTIRINKIYRFDKKFIMEERKGSGRTIRVLAFLTTLSVISICCSAESYQSRNNREFPSDQFIFIEFIERTTGNLQNGWFPPGRRIDGQGYYFNSESKTIKLMTELNNNAQESKLLVGYNIILSGAAGSGKYSTVISVTDLPFQKDSLTIRELEPNGTVHLTLGENSIELPAGNKKEFRNERIENFNNNDKSGSANFTTEISISNYGFIDKSGLIKK